MALSRIENFIGFIRSNKLMDQKDIVRTVKQMSQVDRRVGQIALICGYLRPEQLSNVLLLQTEIKKKFCELATDLGYLDATQAEHILKLQREGLFAFAQAAVVAGVKSLTDMTACLKKFSKSVPEEPEKTKATKPTDLKTDVRAVLLKIKGIAPLPGVVSRVVTMLDDPKVTIDEVGQTLLMDPGLATLFLRIVNSAFFGLRSRIKDITQALVVLGTKKIKELVLVAGIMHKFRDLSASEAAAFWERAMVAGQWSKEIATVMKYEDPDRLFLAGFVCDVGELVIYRHFPSEHRQMSAIIREGKSAFHAEREILGGSHADVSAFLFDIWKFPHPMVQCAMLHHHAVEQVKQMDHIAPETVIVNFAQVLADLTSKQDDYDRTVRIDAAVRRHQRVMKFGDLNIEYMSTVVDRSVSELKRIFEYD